MVSNIWNNSRLSAHIKLSLVKITFFINNDMQKNNKKDELFI